MEFKQAIKFNYNVLASSHLNFKKMHVHERCFCRQIFNGNLGVFLKQQACKKDRDSMLLHKLCS